MKNYVMPAAIAIVGFGPMSIGFNLNGNQANATPGVFAPAVGPGEPTIVWHDQTNLSSSSSNGYWRFVLFRAWSDGTIEARVRWFDFYDGFENDCLGVGDGVPDPNWDDPQQTANGPGFSGWFVLPSPNEGHNARADINRDEIVDSADIGLVPAAWGDAPRNDLPPSDCPLGLVP